MAAVETYNAAEQIDQLEDYDAEPLVINTPGGVVNLQTGEIVPHEVSQRFLKIAGATPNYGRAVSNVASLFKRLVRGR